MEIDQIHPPLILLFLVWEKSYDKKKDKKRQKSVMPLRARGIGAQWAASANTDRIYAWKHTHTPPTHARRDTETRARAQSG